MGLLTSAVHIALASLAVSVICGALFVRRQNRLDQPYLSVAPFKVVVFSGCCIVLIFAIMQNFAMSLLLPLHLQIAFGETAMMAGLLVIPPILAMSITTLFSGRLIDRFGVWPLVPLGFVILLAGQICVALTAQTLEIWALILAALLVYAGAGLVQTPLQTHALKALPPAENPSGVSLINVCMQTAAAIGPALFVGVLSSASARAALGGGSAVEAQVAGFTSATLVAAAIALVGLIATIPLTRKRS